MADRLDPLSELGRSAKHGTEELPDVLTVEELRERCEKEERILRLQYRDTEFPPEWEMGLKARGRQPTTMQGALSRWAYVSHLYRVRNEGLRKTDAETNRNVVRAMLRREPVRVELPSRVVNVTSRSYGAMLEILRHTLRMNEIDETIQRANQAHREVQEKLAGLTNQTEGVSFAARQGGVRGGRKRLRRKLRTLLSLHRRLVIEARLHRQAIYAHAFTLDGSPAQSLDEAPSWWETLTPEDDSALLKAMFMAGHERLSEISDDQPEEKKTKNDFGWHSLITTIEKMVKAEPASYYDVDLFQLAAWARTVNPTEDDLDD